MRSIIPIHVDTDIGDDIDDALALLFASKLSEAELRSVTVVYGDIFSRGRLASKLLSSLGLKKLVALGSMYTLLGFKPSSIPCQASILDNHIEEKQNISTIDAYSIIAHEAEAGTTIVSIGPMTNIALAFLLYPDKLSKCKLVSMGGYLYGGRAEYNIRCDPEAAYNVLHNLKPILVTLDTTLRCIMPTSLIEKIKSSVKTEHKLIYNMMRAWMEHTGRVNPILHDPLTIALAVKPNLARYREVEVKVELSEGPTRGCTIEYSGGSRIRIPVEVDTDSFIELFSETIL
ncbi:MAG: nucleoside hydrolase [Candidatus Bathyarchaeia archaeon]|nr:nucleoside hydrolase [Candidatus Bathyarchaeota archaeon]